MSLRTLKLKGDFLRLNPHIFVFHFRIPKVISLDNISGIEVCNHGFLIHVVNIYFSILAISFL